MGSFFAVFTAQGGRLNDLMGLAENLIDYTISVIFLFISEHEKTRKIKSRITLAKRIPEGAKIGCGVRVEIFT